MNARMFYVVLMGLVLSGCASVESRWQATQQEDNVKAYEIFLQKYPNEGYASSARERIEELKFERAKRTGTEQGYAAYLGEYPEGRFAGEASEAVVQLAFEKASRVNSVDAYELFTSRFPDSPLVAQAATQARLLRFNAALKGEAVAPMEDFLERYPEGSDSDQLRRKLPEIRLWEPQKRLGELVIRLTPKVEANFLGLTRTPSPTYEADLSEIRRLLGANVNPNAVRIAGYEPAKEDTQIRTPGDALVITSSRSPGNRGHVVPAEEQGLTLLEYCEANQLDDAYELLKAHSAK